MNLPRRLDLSAVDQAVLNAASPAFSMVWRWPGLSGAGKAAWLVCYPGEEQVQDLQPATIAAKCGVTDTSGKRALEALAKFGLITILSGEGSRWTVRWNEPAIVARARKIEFTAQGTLFEMGDGPERADEDEPDQARSVESEGDCPRSPSPLSLFGMPAVGGASLPLPLGAEKPPPNGSATDPPRKRDASVGGGAPSVSRDTARTCERTPTRADLALESINSSRDLGTLGISHERSLGSAVASDGSVADPPSVGDVLGGERVPTDRDVDELVDRVGRLARSIYERVNDPGLENGPVLRVAWALANATRERGAEMRGKILRILDDLDARRATGTLDRPDEPRRFFIRAAKRCLEGEFGVTWFDCLPNPWLGSLVETKWLPNWKARQRR